MKKVAYSKSRILSQTRMPNAVSKNLKKGETFTITDVKESSYTDKVTKQERNSDYLVLKNADGVVSKLAVKEFTRMSVLDGGTHYAGSEDDGIELPINFTVSTMKPRLNNKNEPMFSTYAYKLAPQLIAGEIDYVQMVDGGVLDEHPFEALQDYTIEVKH